MVQPKKGGAGMKKVFSRVDMIQFANYLRNGLTNLEYGSKSTTEHLRDWCDIKFKYHGKRKEEQK